MTRTALLLLLAAAACSRPVPPASPAAAAPAPAPAASTPATAPAEPIALTYLGVAGWQIEAGAVTILADPYFSRPGLEGPIRPDLRAIAARSPGRADLIVVG